MIHIIWETTWHCSTFVRHAQGTLIVKKKLDSWIYCLQKQPKSNMNRVLHKQTLFPLKFLQLSHGFWPIQYYFYCGYY